MTTKLIYQNNNINKRELANSLKSGWVVGRFGQWKAQTGSQKVCMSMLKVGCPEKSTTLEIGVIEHQRKAF